MFELLGFFFFLPVVCTAPCTHRDAYYWLTFLKRTTLRFRLHRFSLLHGGVAPLLPGAPSHSSAQASHGSGVSCCRAGALGGRDVLLHACGIFPDQGSNPCPLHWQADSLPLSCQGSPADDFHVLSLLHPQALSPVSLLAAHIQ